jgi:cyclopropane-fatty-acyl-phospholipid synthase
MNNFPTLTKTIYSLNFYEFLINRFFKMIKTGGITVENRNKVIFYGDKNHPLQATIFIYSECFYSQIFWGGGLGLAESYLFKNWDTDDLVCVLRIFSLNFSMVEKIDQTSWGFLLRLVTNFLHYMRPNHLKGAKHNISKHYDLGNNFFSHFLDPTMLYSCGRFEGQSFTLEEASKNKLKYICQSLQLKSSDHLLEIGSGWGGLAIFAAHNYGCKVTTTTISKEQFKYVTDIVLRLGLNKQVTVLFQDYRELAGSYDKLVSIEMIEAVGHQYFNEYFKICSNLVKPNGLFFLQAITIAENRYLSARDSVDFIKKYIFPGCCIPSLGEILKNIGNVTDYNVIKIDDITIDYAKTLKKWRENFLDNLSLITAQGFDETFIRKWLYYFSYCEAGFLERKIFDLQILFAKPDYRVLENDVT